MIDDLTRVYDPSPEHGVRARTKLLIQDLRDGVNLWSHASYLIFMIGLISFLLGVVTFGHGAILPATGIMYDAEVIASFGLAIFAVVVSFFYERRYRRLRRKYQALFDAAKKL